MGDRHAIILILLPILTVAAGVRLRARKPPPSVATSSSILASAGRSPITGRRLRKSRSALSIQIEFLACTLFTILFVSLASQPCQAGEPFAQWIVPWGCLGAVVIFVANDLVRLILAGSLIVIMIGLTANHTALVQGPSYVGNPIFGRGRQAGDRAFLVRSVSPALLRLAVTDGDEAAYPAGWLSDAAFFGKLEAEFRGAPMKTQWVDGRPLWHSWLTGLYRKRLIPMDVWYPGGTLKDAADKLEYRERPR